MLDVLGTAEGRGKIPCPGSSPGGNVAWVGESAPTEGQAAAPDAGGEPVTQCDQPRDLLVEAYSPHRGEARPIGFCGHPGLRQGGQSGSHLLQ